MKVFSSIHSYFVHVKKFIVLTALLTPAFFASAQNDTLLPPYKKFPTLPPAKLLLADSVTYFTKEKIKAKQPVLYMLFNPECEHCLKKTEEITAHIDKFKNVTIVMSTTAQFEQMLEFYEKYNLKNFSNIIVGRDYQFFLPTFYQIKSLPFNAFYNKKHVLISVMEGAPPLEKILEELKK
jgi:thiol-disulfide isomerase/thioredoxin